MSFLQNSVFNLCYNILYPVFLHFLHLSCFSLVVLLSQSRPTLSLQKYFIVFSENQLLFWICFLVRCFINFCFPFYYFLPSALFYI